MSAFRDQTTGDFANRDEILLRSSNDVTVSGAKNKVRTIDTNFYLLSLPRLSVVTRDVSDVVLPPKFFGNSFERGSQPTGSRLGPKDSSACIRSQFFQIFFADGVLTRRRSCHRRPEYADLLRHGALKGVVVDREDHRVRFFSEGKRSVVVRFRRLRINSVGKEHDRLSSAHRVETFRQREV